MIHHSISNSHNHNHSHNHSHGHYKSPKEVKEVEEEDIPLASLMELVSPSQSQSQSQSQPCSYSYSSRSLYRSYRYSYAHIYIVILILNIILLSPSSLSSSSTSYGLVKAQYIDSCSLDSNLLHEFKYDAENQTFEKVVMNDNGDDNSIVGEGGGGDENGGIVVGEDEGGKKKTKSHKHLRRTNRNYSPTYKNKNNNSQRNEYVMNSTNKRGRTTHNNHGKNRTRKQQQIRTNETKNRDVTTGSRNTNTDNNNNAIDGDTYGYDTSTILARECPCGTKHRKGTPTYCPITNGANYCRVPNSTTEAVECYQTSIYSAFITSSWPLALLWILALVIYLIVTDVGRSTLKYILSNACCCCCNCYDNCCRCCRCCRNVFSNRSLIDGIIAREAAMRELIQMARITHGERRRQWEREQQEAAMGGSGGGDIGVGGSGSGQYGQSQPVTYILKTKAYNDGSSAKKEKKSIDIVQGHSPKASLRPGPRAGPGLEPSSPSIPSLSPSNDTMATTPESQASSSFSFEDSPRIDRDRNDIDYSSNYIEEEEDYNGIPSPFQASPSNVLESEAETQPYPLPNNGLCIGDINQDTDDEEEEEVTCTICMVEIKNGERIGVLQCEHLFHSDCLKEWIKRRNVCPLCQAPDIAQERSSNSNSNSNNSAINGNGNSIMTASGGIGYNINASPRPIHPGAFIIRTTGSPIELTHRTSRRRRRTRVRMRRDNNGNSSSNDDNNGSNNQASVSLNGNNGHSDGGGGISRQLFQVNGDHGRSSLSSMASRRVTAVSSSPVVGLGRRSGVDNGHGNVTIVTNRADRNRQQLQILVGDAASARPSSNVHRTMNSMSSTIQRHHQQNFLSRDRR